MFQLVFRRRPRPHPYIRLKPVSRSPRQAVVREYMRMVARLSSRLSLDEVAALVGGEVYDRRQGLVAVNGEVLPKTAWLVRYFMKGLSVGRTARPRKWETVLQKHLSIQMLSSMLQQSTSASTDRARREQLLSQEAR